MAVLEFVVTEGPGEDGVRSVSTTDPLPVTTREGSLVPVGFEQITNLAAAVGLSPPVGAVYAMIQVDSVNVRYRDDGTSPTATVGIKVLADGAIWYTADLDAVEFIEVSAGAVLNVAYYGVG